MRPADSQSGESFQRNSKQILRLNDKTYILAPIFMTLRMSGVKPGLVDNSRYQVMMRKPQRITITLSWSMYQALVEESSLQGRSISNLACYWLERHYAMAKSGGEA